jgi:hypothetical protein
VIDNGFPIRSHAYPSHIHLALETVEDHLGIAIVNFMISQGIDINRQVTQCMEPSVSRCSNCRMSQRPLLFQVKGTWETALHVAVRRGLVATASALMERGADVNAVAQVLMQ